ncbi:MAG: hypothetical protein ACAI44_25675 [Candidatus Sericytochromatia bacterium]
MNKIQHILTEIKALPEGSQAELMAQLVDLDAYRNAKRVQEQKQALSPFIGIIQDEVGPLSSQHDELLAQDERKDPDLC